MLKVCRRISFNFGNCISGCDQNRDICWVQHFCCFCDKQTDPVFIFCANKMLINFWGQFFVNFFLLRKLSFRNESAMTWILSGYTEVNALFWTISFGFWETYLTFFWGTKYDPVFNSVGHCSVTSSSAEIWTLFSRSACFHIWPHHYIDNSTAVKFHVLW